MYRKRFLVLAASSFLLLFGCSTYVQPEWPVVEPAISDSVEVRISAGTDDAEEKASGGVARLDPTLELVRSSANQTVGLRFTGLTIPPGATITNAYLQFKAKVSNSEATDLNIQAQAADNPASFSSSAYNVSSRPRTTASVAWSPGAWTLEDAGSAQRTPDLASVVQEIVNRPGWASGNALAFIVTGTGRRVAWPYDGSPADAPLLHVEYVVTDEPPPTVTVAAAGDIACDSVDPNFNNGEGTATDCRQKHTADAVTAINPDAVLVLGDLQYPTGTYARFMASYDLSWGLHKSKTFPAIGNHEGTSSGSGAGYCQYFGPAAHCNANGTQGGAAYYSFNLGDWHLVVVNSNCDAAGGCGVGSPQYNWLVADLAANPTRCTLAYWHHPRFNSGDHRNAEFMADMFGALYDAGVEIVLSGHAHSYERFAPQDAAGNADPRGVRQFVVGTGGKDLIGISSNVLPNSEARNDDVFGVLKLSLNPTSYTWAFVPEAGKSFTDTGTGMCH